MTLVEVVVTVSIFSLLMLAVMEGFTYIYRVNAYTIAQAYQVDYARKGVQALVRDVREMTYADNGAFPLVVMDPHRIGFYSDVDQDSSVEYVEYTYQTASTTLIKNVYNATGTPLTYNLAMPDETYTLSEYVQNYAQSTSTFLYFDSIGATVTSTSQITDVRYLRAQAIVNVDPVRDPGEFMIRQSASIRNLSN